MAELITLKGWGSPFRIDPNTGGVRVSVSPLVLEESIQTVLGTLIQDRLFLKLFGSRLPILITEGIVDEILDVAQHEIMLALSQFEPRIDVREVKFFAVTPTTPHTPHLMSPHIFCTPQIFANTRKDTETRA